MAALSETNLNNFDKSVKSSRRASIISRRSSVSDSIPGHPGRRLSRAFTTGIGGGHTGVKSSMSMSTISPSKVARVRHENTYRLKPEAEAKFMPVKCQEELKVILESYLDGVTYDSRAIATLTKRIADEIKLKVKDFKLPRYKIISQVFIGSKGDQCMQMSSRSIWDPSTDNFASQSFENESLFAVATVHCTYFE